MNRIIYFLKKNGILCLGVVVLLIAFLVSTTMVEKRKSGKLNTALRFSQGDSGSFVFNTGIIRGTLRMNGQAIGLKPFYFMNDSLSLSSNTGIFNHYRVFTVGKRYGYGARRWPGSAILAEDGTVHVFWPRTKYRPFELSAIYTIKALNIIDLTTKVKAEEDLKNFEVFLASYLNNQFTESKVWAYPSSSANTEPIFISAKKELGEWLSFPRDEDALAIINDGRWKLEPHPLEWLTVSNYALPLMVRQNPESGIAVVAITKRSDCFGVFTPHNTEKHFSHYMSLFGYNIDKGDSAQVHSRLVILKNPTDDEIIQVTNDFLWN